MLLKKNMTLGNKIIYFIFFFVFSLKCYSNAEEKITSSPLINLEKIKPSFEETSNELEEINNSNEKLKKKTLRDKNILSTSHAVLIGLDKITAKSSELIINLDEVKVFGPLEIKILKCGKIRVNNKNENIAYMQVKDLAKSENDKVFIFNGWTFSSDPNIMPFDHAIYDLQLLNCRNV